MLITIDQGVYKLKNCIIVGMNKLMPWIAGLIVILGLAGIVLLSQSAKTDVTDTAKLLEVKETDWAVGPAEVAVTLIEYSDFQCPACKEYYPVLRLLEEEFPTSLRVVYRHFPLTSHPNATPAARAAEAAGVQGKFWEMHDILFNQQDEWKDNADPRIHFGVYAGELGMDVEQFVGDMLSTEIQKKVANDYRDGVILNVQGTPTFFLNGEKIGNPLSYENFKKVIESKVGTTTPPQG